MDEQQFKSLFPNASRSTIAANAQVSNTGSQRDPAPALDRAAKGKETSLGRVIVRFTGYRVRPLDPDSFAGSTKGLLDGLKHAYLLRDDNFREIKLETSQIKVAHFSKERTDIEIIYP